MAVERWSNGYYYVSERPCAKCGFNRMLHNGQYFIERPDGTKRLQADIIERVRGQALRVNSVRVYTATAHYRASWDIMVDVTDERYGRTSQSVKVLITNALNVLGVVGWHKVEKFEVDIEPETKFRRYEVRYSWHNEHEKDERL